jgi:hypothetical protein
MAPGRSLEAKNKAQCAAMLAAWRKYHEEKGLQIVNVYGDGFCAYNCFCLMLFGHDVCAKKLREDFIMWLGGDPSRRNTS